jgi:6-bladed beta-propeller
MSLLSSRGHNLKRRSSSLLDRTVLLLTGAILLILSLGAGRAPNGGQPPRVFSLPELEEASCVRAEHGRVYIQDKKDIAVYSFDDGRFLRRIGRPGQGPGEFALLGGFYVLSDRIVVADIAKTLFFSVEGEYLGQIVPPTRIMTYPFLPVGKHFVGFPRERQEDGSLLPPKGVVYDAAGKPAKRFIDVPDILPPPPPPPPRGSSRPAGSEDVLMIRDYFDYAVHDDKIFVADSSKGFFISVFDETGTLLYEIRQALEKLKVTRDYRDFAKKSQPERYWATHKPIFPDYFPAIAAFKIDGGRIYAITPAKRDGRYEVIVMDLKGNILERGFRFPIQIDLWVPYRFARTFDVEAARFVWVEYNDSKEQYELHID